MTDTTPDTRPRCGGSPGKPEPSQCGTPFSHSSAPPYGDGWEPHKDECWCPGCADCAPDTRPRCQTCGGKGRVYTTETNREMRWDSPCPDCTPPDADTRSTDARPSVEDQRAWCATCGEGIHRLPPRPRFPEGRWAHSNGTCTDLVPVADQPPIEVVRQFAIDNEVKIAWLMYDAEATRYIPTWSGSVADAAAERRKTALIPLRARVEAAIRAQADAALQEARDHPPVDEELLRSYELASDRAVTAERRLAAAERDRDAAEATIVGLRDQVEVLRAALAKAVDFGQGWIDNGDFPGPQSVPQAELDAIAAILDQPAATRPVPPEPTCGECGESSGAMCAGCGYPLHRVRTHLYAGSTEGPEDTPHTKHHEYVAPAATRPVPHEPDEEECRDPWHNEDEGRRPDCPTCGVEDEGDGEVQG